MNLSIRSELIDMLTDWAMEQNQDICCSCRKNRSEEDIGTTSCPVDFDMFSCPNAVCDLADTIERVADMLICALPEPDEE